MTKAGAGVVADPGAAIYQKHQPKESRKMATKKPAVTDAPENMTAAVAAFLAVSGEAGAKALTAVLSERVRQIEEKGKTLDQDDSLTGGELARAGACYALASAGAPHHRAALSWPFAAAMRPAGGHLENSTKAGALLLAELERAYRTEQAAE